MGNKQAYACPRFYLYKSKEKKPKETPEASRANRRMPYLVLGATLAIFSFSAWVGLNP